MGSIGRWLDTECTPAMEDRLLTTKLVPFSTGGLWPQQSGVPMGCLGGVAYGHVEYGAEGVMALPGRHWFRHEREWQQFNLLCQRLVGMPRAAQRAVGEPALARESWAQQGGALAAGLIRNRILKNRARRVLVAVPCLGASA